MSATSEQILADKVALILPKVDAARIEAIACTAYEACRGWGLARGEMATPTWQIAPTTRKAEYLGSVRRLLEQPMWHAIDLHAECREEALKQGQENSWTRGWEELSEEQRQSLRLFVAVVRSFGS